MSADQVIIAGIPVTVVSNDEAETAQLVVCMPKGTSSPFTDNLEGECSACGCEIIFRPHVPSRPPKVCLGCATAQIEADQAVKQ
jgi:hypothetical protein